MKKIIYILGAGRTGTTLLDIILGNAENVFSAGEIYKFPKLQGCPHGFDEDTEHYKFWKKVEQSLFAKQDGKVDYDVLLKLSEQFEFHRSFIPLFFGNRSKQKETLFKQYINNFFSSVFENIDESIIIDSSKYPLRALALYKYLEYEVNFIYLLRDPVEVVNSFSKKEIEQPSKNFISANLYYFVINLMCRWVLGKIQVPSPKYQDPRPKFQVSSPKHAQSECEGSQVPSMPRAIAKGPKVVVVKYSHLIANPISELQKIQSALGIDLTKAISKIENNQPLSTGLIFEGNRIRLSKTIFLKKGEKKSGKKFRDYFTTLFNGFWWKGEG